MRKKREMKTKKLLRYYSLLAGGITTLYLVAGFIGGQQLLFSDMQQKGKVAGAMITAVVRAYGPPKVPVITASSGCNAQKTPYVLLQWPLDEDVTSFDIYRDDAELMLGLTDNNYFDSNVAGGTSFAYYVIAKGPKGSATSETATIFVAKCSAITNPIVSVTTYKGKNIESYSSVPSTSERKPVFSGMTNIPNATISLEIHSNQIIYATIQANENGYWQWLPPAKLPEGAHVLYITATDPLDPTIIATSSFVFKIKEDEDESDSNKKKKSPSLSSQTTSNGNPVAVNQNNNTEEIPRAHEKPVDFDVTLENKTQIKGVDINEEAYRGEDLEIKIAFTDVVKENELASLAYVLISSDQKTMAQYTDTVSLQKDQVITKKIPLPYDLDLGKYKLQVSATIGDTIVSHENYFILKDRPIIKIGAGAFITYADVVSNLGWLAIITLSFLAVVGLLAGWEHRLAQRVISRATERILKKKGFIS